MPRWIVYGALGIWISGALVDLAVAMMRVLYSTGEYGRPVRPAWSYFVNGIGCLFVYGTLTWLFYWEYLGEWSAVIIGTLIAIPEFAYFFWSRQSLPESTFEHKTPRSDSRL
jgi:hypothetical protein